MIITKAEISLVAFLKDRPKTTAEDLKRFKNATVSRAFRNKLIKLDRATMTYSLAKEGMKLVPHTQSEALETCVKCCKVGLKYAYYCEACGTPTKYRALLDRRKIERAQSREHSAS